MFNLHTSRNVMLLATVLSVLFFGWFTWGVCTFSNDSCFGPPEAGPKEVRTVTFVIDGDSFTVKGGDEIRLIGIDTPERGSSYYAEARTFLKDLIDGRKITLEEDLDDEDKYDRQLRYAYIDNMFVNAVLVEEGYAKVLTISPNIKYAEILQDAQKKAQREERGIWSSSGGAD